MLKVKGLMVFYENMLALNNVTLGCRKGEIIGVFGANSAGKSTLMYALSGILLDIMNKEKMKGGERITQFGEIRYLDRLLNDVPAHKRARMGIVLCPERRRLFPESSVLDNLKIGGYLATRAQVRRTLEEVLDLFAPLKKLLKRQAGFLSGGEQQMVAIGRAMMAQPKILLLDEPLLGLAPSIQHVVVASIRSIRSQRDISVVVAEQYARPVLPCVDYAFIMENGSIVLDGRRDDLLENPDVKAAYFGYE